MSEIPAGKQAVVKKSAVPIYAVGAVWLLWGILLPLYKPGHLLLCAAVSAAVYGVLSAVLPKKTEYIDIREPEVATGSEEADDLIRSGRQLLAEIAAAANTIENEEVRQKFKGLDATSRSILDYVAKKPAAAGSLRRFFNFYLPTLKKLAETYALMEKQGVTGENLSEGKARIAQMLDTMDAAFKKQLDALFGETTLDITTDIAAIQGLMAQEGLTGDAQLKAEPQETAAPAPGDGEIKLTLDDHTGGNNQ